jgi:hypothetical protein
MTRLQFSAICALAFGAACTKEQSFTEPLPPLAAVHWVNAVPDTGQQDLRIVDIVSNAGLFDADFRGSTMFYQAIEAGSRTLRIFMSSTTNQQIASTVLTESSLNLTAGAQYTVIHSGFARGGAPAKAVTVIQDNPPTPAVGQIAVRVINAAAGLGAVDVWFRPHAVNVATADSLPDTRDAAAVAFGTASTYAAKPVDATGTDSIRIIVTAAGTKTPILFGGVNGLKAPAGLAGDIINNPIAGTRVAQSVLTAVVVPASVAGSQAPQGGAFGSPSAVFLVDRRPPNTAP